MDKQLKTVAVSYDKGISCGSKGVNLYDRLPDYIVNDPYFKAWQDSEQEGVCGSEREEIKQFLSPQSNMNFIDLGCCLNLMFKGYASWESLYHAVDISKKTIKLLSSHVKKEKLKVGAIVCGSVHETPFDNNFFDIGACIGVLEYFEKNFVEETLKEIYRILKPNAKFVLDVPDINNPIAKLMMKIEAYIGRPDKFNLCINDFENMLKKYFIIDAKLGESMVFYFLTCKK